MRNWQESDENLMKIWWKSDENLTRIWRESDENLTRIWRESEENLTRIWQESDYYGWWLLFSLSYCKAIYILMTDLENNQATQQTNKAGPRRPQKYDRKYDLWPNICKYLIWYKVMNIEVSYDGKFEIKNDEKTNRNSEL